MNICVINYKSVINRWRITLAFAEFAWALNRRLDVSWCI